MMPIERQAAEKLEANSQYGKGVHETDAVSAYPPELQESEAEKNWKAAQSATAQRDVATMYAERAGYAYGFIEGMTHKLRSSRNLIGGCKSPECVLWIQRDLEAMIDACVAQLESMDS